MANRIVTKKGRENPDELNREVDKFNRTHDFRKDAARYDRIITDDEFEGEWGELSNGLLIDKDGLDEGLEHQPERLHEVADKLAIAMSRRDASKQNLADIKARVDALLRRQHREAESKVTEKEIDAQVTAHAEVAKASDEHLYLSAVAGRLAALKEAFQDRSKMLGKLVDLWIAGYFSEVTPRAAGRKFKDSEHLNNRERMNREREARD